MTSSPSDSFELPAPTALDRAPPSLVVPFPAARANARILLVSDDVQLRALLGELFAAHGYDVVAVGGPSPLLRRHAADWDAAIVDAAAPHCAARWLRSLEATTRAPTIALRAAADTAGALWNRVDAVLHAPLDARRLLLIVRGLVADRRRAAAQASHTLTVGPLSLDPLLNTATLAAREISLTGVETRILRELMLAAATPVSRDRLMRDGLGRGGGRDDRALDTHVKRLRAKLATDRHGRTPIRTVRGIGYLLLGDWHPAIGRR